MNENINKAPSLVSENNNSSSLFSKLNLSNEDNKNNSNNHSLFGNTNTNDSSENSNIYVTNNLFRKENNSLFNNTKITEIKNNLFNNNNIKIHNIFSNNNNSNKNSLFNNNNGITNNLFSFNNNNNTMNLNNKTLDNNIKDKQLLFNQNEYKTNDNNQYNTSLLLNTNISLDNKKGGIKSGLFDKIEEEEETINKNNINILSDNNNQISTSNNNNIIPCNKNNLIYIKEYSNDNEKKITVYKFEMDSSDTSFNLEKTIFDNLENNYKVKKNESFKDKIKINCYMNEPEKISFSIDTQKQNSIEFLMLLICLRLYNETKNDEFSKMNFCLMKNYTFIDKKGIISDYLNDGDDVYIISKDIMKKNLDN